MQSLFVLCIVNQVHSSSTNRKRLACSSGSLKAHTYWIALPLRRSAGRIWPCIVRQALGNLFSQDRFSSAQLRYSRECLLPIVCDTAIRNVIPIPTRGRIYGIEICQVDRRNAAGRAVHEKPSTALPLPSRSGVVRQAVIHAERSSYHKYALRDVVWRSCYVLFHPAVDDQGSNLDRCRLLVDFISGKTLCRQPPAKRNHVHFGRRGRGQNEQKANDLQPDKKEPSASHVARLCIARLAAQCQSSHRRKMACQTGNSHFPITMVVC